MATKYHQTQKLELSENDGKNAEQRRAARAVNVTGPYSTGSEKDSPEQRRVDHFRSNGHQAGTPVGLASAVQHNLSRTREDNTSKQPLGRPTPNDPHDCK